MVDATKDYIAGMAAGIATVIVGHPFDTVKVKLQTQNTAVSTMKYRNAWDCTSHILRTEGMRGLYKGATSSFVGMAMESSILFGIYTQVKKALSGKEVGGRPNMAVVSVAGATGGACVAFVLCPAELVKCRLQVQAKAAPGTLPEAFHYRGPIDCVIKTVRREGIPGMYRGIVPTIMRESFGNLVFFGTYETTRYNALTLLNVDPRRGAPADEEAEVSGEGALPKTTGFRKALIEGGVGILSGGLAGVAFWSTILPFDVAKTRIQTQLDPNASRSVLSHLRRLHMEAGLRGLWAGLSPTLVRAFPANAASVLTWELTARMLSRMGESK